MQDWEAGKERHVQVMQVSLLSAVVFASGTAPSLQAGWSVVVCQCRAQQVLPKGSDDAEPNPKKSQNDGDERVPIPVIS